MASPDPDTSRPLFPDLRADDSVPDITEISSLCVSCEQQGMTRLFLTRIPFFKEVVVSSFDCEECGYKNSELIPAGRIQDRGIRVSVNISTQKDLNRQVVQTNSAVVSIPDIQFEVPPTNGALTTVEGILEKAIQGLSQEQPVRKALHPDLAEQIEGFLTKLEELKEGKKPFQFVVDDPSGNSFVENPLAPHTDPAMTVTHYRRSREQNLTLDIPEEDEREVAEVDSFSAKDEVLVFQGNCPNCCAPCPTNMKLVNVPHFKEVVIMSTNCDACGLRDSEVQGASGIGEKGKKITLRITEMSDMARDVLKSDTCSVLIPELEFETGMGSIRGKFTTVEGLLNNIQEMLTTSNPFTSGDSSEGVLRKKLDEFCKKIDAIISGERSNVHLVLDDPAGNSYIQNLYAPDNDPEMIVEVYDRTEAHDEELGIADMKT